MDTATLRSIPSLTPNFTAVSRSRRHFAPLMHPPGYPATPPTCPSTMPTLIDDDASTYMDVLDTPMGRPSTPFPDLEAEDQEFLPCSIVRSTSRSWPLGSRCGIYLGRDTMSPTEPKFKSKIPVATTYLSRPRTVRSNSTLSATLSPPPLTKHVLAYDSRLANVRSGVEDKEAELQRLQYRIREVNTRLETLNASGGSRRAKYRSIISRGRPLASFQDEDEDTLSEMGPSLDFRLESASVLPFHTRVTSGRFSRAEHTRQNTLSSASSIAWPEGSEVSSQGRHRTRPSDTQVSSISGGQETDETYSDSDHVSLKNFPATPRSRRSRIPRRPVSSMMSTSSFLSDMPTVYETRTATPIIYKDIREAGSGVSTVYNHGSTRTAKKTATPIKTIEEQDEMAAETDTLNSEQVEQDLGTLGGYLVTPDPTPLTKEPSRSKFSRETTPMHPAPLRVVNCSPKRGFSGDVKGATGPSPPKFALSPAVRPQHLSETTTNGPAHPAYRDDPFGSIPAVSQIHRGTYPSQATPQHNAFTPATHNPMTESTSTPSWPLADEPELDIATPAHDTSSRRPRVFRKLFQNTATAAPPPPPAVNNSEDTEPKSTTKRPLRNWLKKITPHRTKPEPIPAAPIENSLPLPVALKRAPTARSSAPPRLPRHRDSTLRFEQMLMKEIGGDSPSTRLARRGSVSSMQLLQRTVTQTTSSVASTVCPVFTHSPIRPQVRPVQEYHMRTPTISTFRCSMAFV